MTTYMLSCNYTQAGLKGLLAEGGSSREAALRATVESVGGTLDACYYAFGDSDLYLIASLPDTTAATSLSLNISAAAGITVTTTVLLAPADVDAAAAQAVAYRPPGA